MASPTYSDLVTPVYYDEYGRESTKYLPYSNQSMEELTLMELYQDKEVL